MEGAGNRAGLRVSVAVLLAVVAGTLAFAGKASPADPACTGGTREVVKVGIVQANGCWTKQAVTGGTIYTARYVDQPGGWIDMNGFGLSKSGPKAPVGDGVQINTANGEVKGIGNVQFNSVRWPEAGISPMGGPVPMAFTAPNDGELVIEDLRFFTTNAFLKSLLGLIPVQAETPITIGEDGTGSMDLTVSLGGYFALKGKPQSAVVNLPTKIGEGTKFDGFQLDLQEVDALKVITLENLNISYRPSTKTLVGEAGVRFPFTSKKDPDKKKEKGISGGFAIEDGAITMVKMGATGLKIPIGAPPTPSYLTNIAGGINFKKDTFILNLDMGASIGEEVPLPWGATNPLDLQAAMKAGLKNNQYFFRFDGGVKLFRIPVGAVYLGIYSSSGMEFGGSLGVGLPSFKDNRNDPFYVGARIDGWISGTGFQFEGRADFKLFGVSLLSGRALINKQVIGGCWKVWWFDGGAVYDFKSKRVSTFGTTCGLDRYRQKFTGSASASAGQGRKITLGPKEVVLAARGQGGEAPRFRLRGDDGQVFNPPKFKDGMMRGNYGFFVNDATGVTNVVLRRPAGTWTVEPLKGSPRIISLKAGRVMPPERVTGKVVRRNGKQVLVWDSKGQPNTSLVFTEVLNNGTERPLLTTSAASGRKVVKPFRLGNFGQRKLRVTVVHGGTLRDQDLLGTFRVNRPAKLQAPGRVAGARDLRRVHVRWSGVRGAKGYLIQVLVPVKGKKPASFLNIAGPKRRQVYFPEVPGATRGVARVYALNYMGKPGRPGTASFRLGPKRESLKTAVRSAVKRASISKDSLRLTVVCPPGGSHCRNHVTVKRNGKTYASRRFQQPPDSINRVRIKLASVLKNRTFDLKLSSSQITGSEAAAARKLRYRG